jgi:hypothetical protein
MVNVRVATLMSMQISRTPVPSRWQEYVKRLREPFSSHSLHHFLQYCGGIPVKAFWRLMQKKKNKVSKIKQSMLLRGGDIKCFSTPLVMEAMKACRYTTAELKIALLKQRESNQLPLTYDLINSVRDHYLMLVVSIPSNVICAGCICSWSLVLTPVKG